MMHNEINNIRIAITSDSISHRNHLQKSMEHNGIQVVLNESLTQRFMNKLNDIESDVVLFDVEAIEDEHLEYLDQLLEQTNIPVIINDISSLTFNEPKLTSKWNNQLLEKIAGITGRSYGQDLSIETGKIKHSPSQLNQAAMAKNVWVLGASLGGPDALKQFLSEIPGDIPVAFVLAQHLGENFVSLLAGQLDKYTELEVIVPRAGHVIRHGEVLVAPTGKRLVINPIGAVEYKAVSKLTRYSPSIDNAVSDVATRYKTNAGAIIFSGMCDDGVMGCENLIHAGGQVWTQDSKSCVISAMSESVAKKVPVSFTGSPKQLAMQLISLYIQTH